jgi:prevent-host-death family protein
MSEIGVRELKARASEIVRRVQEERQRYVVTVRGRPAAILLPVDEASIPPTRDEEQVWEELCRLGQEIGAGWQATQNSTELLSSMRR